MLFFKMFTTEARIVALALPGSMFAKAILVFSFDFSKAFDSVPYAIVCNKLMSLNINPYVTVINWFVCNTKQ